MLYLFEWIRLPLQDNNIQAMDVKRWQCSINRFHIQSAISIVEVNVYLVLVRAEIHDN